MRSVSFISPIQKWKYNVFSLLTAMKWRTIDSFITFIGVRNLDDPDTELQ